MPSLLREGDCEAVGRVWLPDEGAGKIEDFDWGNGVSNLWLFSCGAQNLLPAWSAYELWPLHHPHLASSRTASASVTMQLTAVHLWKHGDAGERANLWIQKKKVTLFGWLFLLAPQTGLEPVTPRLTAACSTDWAIKAKLKKCRRRPIFPGRFQPSIFGTVELNYRVRDGNGWTLNVINTD